METATFQDELRLLGTTLQEDLRTAFKDEIPFQVRCGLKQGSLIILVEHPPSLIPDPQKTFETIQNTLDTQSLAFNGHARLLLRVLNQKQPYAFHRYELSKPALVDLEFDPTPEPESLETSSELPPVQEVETAPAEFKPVTPQKFPLWLIAAGIAVSVLSFGSSLLYALSRPCIVRACVPLQQAKANTEAAAKTLKTYKNHSGIELAEQQLTQSNQLLKQVPFWSKRHGEAQQLKQVNQTQAESLDRLQTAMERALAAAQKSQNPPHPLTQWQEVQTLWQQAIALLEDFPITSYAYPMVSEKSREYQQNLVAINQRIITETQAAQQLQAAKDIAKAASARQGIAQTEDSWARVQQDWAQALSALRQIPQGSLVYSEAQQLLNQYQGGWRSARDRQTREEFALQTYNQAISAAQQAQSLEQSQQFGAAVAAWQQALDAAQQVPKDTLYHTQAQPLISTYTTALTAAQDKFRVETLFQTASNQLSQSCSGTPPVCSYSITNQLITVRLTPDYVQSLRESLVVASSTGDQQTTVNIDQQLQSLQTNFEAIATVTNLTLELYDPYNALLGTYTPKPTVTP